MSPTKAIKMIVAWSFSRLDTYLGCPQKAKFKFLDKLPEPPAPALERGSHIHKLCEGYLIGTIKRLPKELKLFAEEFKALRKIAKHLQVEAELAFDKDWKPVGWFDYDCWCRIKVDLMYDDPYETDTRAVTDWKTGRVNPKHKDQLELYAIGAFLTAPKHITRVDTTLAYLDCGEVVKASFVRKDVPALMKKWAKKAAPMLKDKSFKAKPGDACRFCPWSKARGGQCQF